MPVHFFQGSLTPSEEKPKAVTSDQRFALLDRMISPLDFSAGKKALDISIK